MVRSATIYTERSEISYTEHRKYKTYGIVLHIKMQYTRMFKFYLQIFTGFQCGFLVSCGRCPICERFRPNSYESCPHPWSQPFLLSVPVVFSNLQEEVEQKLYL